MLHDVGLCLGVLFKKKKKLFYFILLNSGIVLCNISIFILAVCSYPLSAAYCITMICQALAGKWNIL